jgi:hypothetical protein
MKKIHFSSQLAKEKDNTKKDPNLNKVFHFIINLRNTMKEQNLRNDQLIAVDVVKFRSHSHFLRTFGPSGRVEFSIGLDTITMLLFQTYLLN